MKVSTRARYGLRALFDIAYHNLGRPTLVKDIARRQGVTPRYLTQILTRLRRAGLVTSRRGPKGGFALSRPLEAITVGDVVRAADGPIRLADDAPARTPPPGGAAAKGPSRTQAPDVWEEIGREVEALLDGLTLADLCARAEAAGLPRMGETDRLMYFI